MNPLTPTPDDPLVTNAVIALDSAIHAGDLRGAIAAIKGCKRAARAQEVLVRVGFAVRRYKTMRQALAECQTQLIRACRQRQVRCPWNPLDD